MSNYPNQTTTTSTEKSAKSIDEAIAEALNELGITKEDAVIEIVQEPSKGFLGLGAKDAVVKVTPKNAASVSVKPQAAVKPAEAATESESEVTAEAVKTEVKKSVSPNSIYNSKDPIENAKNFIGDVLKAMGIDVEITATFDGDMININLAGENMGIVIGKRGDTLDSLQYLTSLVVNQSSEEYVKVTIDTENYREKRSEALITLSNRLAQKVTRTGKRFALEPMNPYERRIIHANLQESADVSTFSVGQEPYRKVVIAPKNAKPYAKPYGKKSYGKGKGERSDRPRRQSDRGYQSDRGPQSAARGGYSKQSYSKVEKPVTDAAAQTEQAENTSATYKADFKPTQHKAEYKNFEEYLAAHSND